MTAAATMFARKHEQKSQVYDLAFLYLRTLVKCYGSVPVILDPALS